MAKREIRLERWLGPRPLAFSLRLAGRVIRGHMGRQEHPLEEAQQHVRRHLAEAADAGVQLFCGGSDRVLAKLRVTRREGVMVYAVRSVAPSEIAALCDVGIPPYYNSPEAIQCFIDANPNGVMADGVRKGFITVEQLAGPRPDNRRLRSFLDTLCKRCPFKAIYADRKGFLGAFDAPVSAEDANWVEQRLKWLDPEAEDIVAPLKVREYILKHQQFHLWWD